MARARSQNAALADVIANCRHPAYMLNDQRTIVFCNPALCDWVGMPEQEIVGRECRYHSGENADDLAAGLCPPPDAIGPQPTRGEVSAAVSGQQENRGALFQSFFNIDGDLSGVLVVVDDRAADDLAPRDESAEMHQALLSLRRQIGQQMFLTPLLGESPRSQQLRMQARIAMKSHCSLLLIGPPGSGLTPLARSIHAGRPGADSTALAPMTGSLLDAELLQATIRATFLSPDAGSPIKKSVLLLLEADQLSAAAQQELAGFLTLPGFELSIISTSRTSLEALAARGEYCETLANLLSPLVLEIPPLARRAGDIPMLSQRCLERRNALGGAQKSGFTTEALDQLAAHPWRRNLEELQEVVAEAHRTSAGPNITANDLPKAIRQTAAAERYAPPEEERIDLDAFLAQVESELIARAMKQAKGNKTKAAELLGASRARIHRKLSEG